MSVCGSSAYHDEVGNQTWFAYSLLFHAMRSVLQFALILLLDAVIKLIIIDSCLLGTYWGCELELL